MKRTRHTVEQVITKLRQADADLSAGLSVQECCKKLAISEGTYHRWRKQYGGMQPNQLRQLKQLQKQNAQLKKLVADQALDLSILKEVVAGKY